MADIEQRVQTLEVLVRQLQGAVRRGTGSPEGVVDAPRGSLFERDDTGDVYKKTTDRGTLTGWVAL